MKKKTVKDDEGYLGMFSDLFDWIVLMRYSDQGGSGMGIILRRRHRTSIKTKSPELVCDLEEETSSEDGTRKHNVVLRKEITNLTFSVFK